MSQDKNLDGANAFQKLMSHLENPEDIRVLFRMLYSSSESPDPYMKAIIDFAEAKADESTAKWRIEVNAKCQRESVEENLDPSRVGKFHFDEAYRERVDQLDKQKDLRLLDSLHTQSSESPELGAGVAGSPKEKVQETEQGATQLVDARENPGVSDMQGWEEQEQGQDRGLTRDDERRMSGKEVDEECASWDALIMTVTREIEAAGTFAEPDASSWAGSVALRPLFSYETAGEIATDSPGPSVASEALTPGLETPIARSRIFQEHNLLPSSHYRHPSFENNGPGRS